MNVGSEAVITVESLVNLNLVNSMSLRICFCSPIPLWIKMLVAIRCRSSEDCFKKAQNGRSIIIKKTLYNLSKPSRI